MRVDLAGIGGSALTDARIAVPEPPGAGIPVTYVPARNTLLLSLALAWAEVLGRAGHLHRRERRRLFAAIRTAARSSSPPSQALAAARDQGRRRGRALRGSTRRSSSWTKAQIIAAGAALGVDYAQTVSCYQADAEGRACGRCDSCRLRRAGFEAAGIADPTRYQRL